MDQADQVPNSELPQKDRIASRSITILLILIWLAFLIRALFAFRPDSSLLLPYNSDGAIPVLMSNFQTFNPFCLFYWGQDRFGAWPFLLLDSIGFLSNVHWSPAALSAAVVFFVLAGAWPLYFLSGKRAWVVVLYVALIVLQPAIRLSLLGLSQPYSWQIPVILWGWLAIRKLAGADSAKASHLATAGLLCALATWTSPVSGPLLLVLGLIEWVFWWLSSASVKAERVRNLLLATLPSLIGILAERALNFWFRTYVGRTFDGYKTHLRLDVGHLLENARALGARLLSEPWWILSVIGLATAAAIVAEWIVSARHRPARSTAARDTLEPVVVGLVTMAFLAFAVADLVQHVRENDYNGRYLTPVHFFGGLSGGSAVGLIALRLWQARWRATRLLNVGLTLAASLALWLVFPAFGANPEYGDLQAASDWLGAQPSKPVLLGGYWGTYVFASLSASRPIVPVPAEGESQRTPWTTDEVRSADEIVVSQYNYDGFGPSTDPVPWILESGNVLRRIERSRWSRGKIVFWKYRNETSKAVELNAPQAVANWNACFDLRDYSVTFAPVTSGHLLLWAEYDAEVPPVRADWIDESGAAHELLATHSAGRLRTYRLEHAGAAISRIVLRPAGSLTKCRIAGLVVVRES